MKLQHAMTWKSAGMMACGAVAAALFAACGQDAGTDTSTASTDTASAYAALSASVQACTDQKDECETAAASDATKLAACADAAKSCIAQTKSAQDTAKKRLSDDAQSCVRECRGHGRHGDDAGVDDSDMHNCVSRHAPAVPACIKDFGACLEKTGLTSSSTPSTIDDATKNAIVACVQTAHDCFMNDFGSHHRDGNGGPRGDAGHKGIGEGGRPAFPGAEAGHHGPGEGGRPAFPGAAAGHEAHHAGGEPSLPEAGRTGRGMREPAAGAPAPGTRGRRDGAGGAGGN